MNLRKPCEHGNFDFHEYLQPGYAECPGGTEPTTEELVEELNCRRASGASYDIEIPDFVNRHGVW